MTSSTLYSKLFHNYIFHFVINQISQCHRNFKNAESFRKKKIKKLNLGAGHKQFMIAQDCIFLYFCLVYFIEKLYYQYICSNADSAYVQRSNSISKEKNKSGKNINNYSIQTTQQQQKKPTSTNK